MKRVCILLAAAGCAMAQTPGPGISEALARERAQSILSLRYELAFTIPEKRSEPVRGKETIRFTLRAPRRVVLDFAQPRDRILSAPDATFPDGHIVIPGKTGENAIAIEFIAGDDALNRNDDFLYTLFVPARAHLAFPCFDQPDLKARFSLKLDVPPGWRTVTNGDQTPPLSTYLFAFAAGKFQVETAQRDGRTFHMFHRETDAAKVARNRDAIFDLHAKALNWLEDYTQIKYPWGKFDFVLIPSFQFGGMEHPGAIFYNASNLLLEESATQNQYLNRASVIAHETSHMWFGDLVTMRWFNDVWMKEVMANFMAAKIVNPSFPEINHDLRFLLAHYPAAYSVDRTAGANPIRQTLENLDEAGTLYGNIIYDKAPVVMRQLEMILGEQAFRDGMRDYLKRYSFGNATWIDLIRALSPRTRENLPAWSHAWVEVRGRPEITTTLADSQITLSQRDPLGRGVTWPQHLQIALGYPDRVETVAASLNGTAVKTPLKARPLYVLPNGGGLGYGLFLLEAQTRRYLLEHIEDIPDALTRGSAWVDVWENLLEARIQPADFFRAAVRALPKETDEQNTQLVLGYLARAFWLYPPHPDLEAFLRGGIERARTASQKSAWFNAYRDVVLSPEGLKWLEQVWRREQKIEGLPLAEPDEINMALELAVREVSGWQQILNTQRDRTQNPDRKARFEFVMPALSTDPAVRERAFERFRQVENRRREPWVLESMRYLNHPLRQQHALRFIRPSLELLLEIQRTGDIFFPQRWVDAALEGHTSPEAARMVREFLAGAKLPERLRWDVLTAADDLMRR